MMAKLMFISPLNEGICDYSRVFVPYSPVKSRLETGLMAPRKADTALRLEVRFATSRGYCFVSEASSP